MQIVLYILVGFFAQMIDGTLGMAYGVSCRTFLKTFGKLPSNVVSALVHYAEIPTSFISMVSHVKFKNIDKKVFINLVIPGIIGSILGAYIISLDFSIIEILIDVYLIIMGIIVFSKGLKKLVVKKEHKKYYLRFLGLIGAFFDACGGGGWGPIVTGSLLSNTNEPKKVIGTVNSSEFIVTLTSSISFILLVVNIQKYILVLIGLIIGGIVAAPLAAKLCMKIDERKLYFLVGTLLVVLNICNLLNFIW